jgi:hypothetical protein
MNIAADWNKLSAGDVSYPSLAAAYFARLWIDFAAGWHWFSDWKTGAIVSYDS